MVGTATHRGALFAVTPAYTAGAIAPCSALHQKVMVEDRVWSVGMEVDMTPRQDRGRLVLQVGR